MAGAAHAAAERAAVVPVPGGSELAAAFQNPLIRVAAELAVEVEPVQELVGRRDRAPLAPAHGLAMGAERFARRPINGQYLGLLVAGDPWESRISQLRYLLAIPFSVFPDSAVTERAEEDHGRFAILHTVDKLLLVFAPRAREREHVVRVFKAYPYCVEAAAFGQWLVISGAPEVQT